MAIAHIRAENEHDLFFLRGYVHAQDRLFQMDVSRREAGGTLARTCGFGRSCARRSTAHHRAATRRAVRSIPVISARARAALQAYADGVNAFVGSHPGSLPPECDCSRIDTVRAVDRY